MLYQSYESISKLETLTERQAAHRRRTNIQLLAVFSFIITFLFLTNPTETQHRKAFLNYLELAKNYDNKLYHYQGIMNEQPKTDILATILLRNNINLMNIDSRDLQVNRENYYLFSNTKVNIKNHLYYIKGWALLGRVYFSSTSDFEFILKFQESSVYGEISAFLIFISILIYICIVSSWRRPNFIFWGIIFFIIYLFLYSDYFPSFN